MNRIKNLGALAAFSLVLLALPSVASAQWRDRDYGRNNGGYYGNNGYYGNIRQNIQNIRNRARTFERLANRYDDRNDDRNDDWYRRNSGYYNNNLDNLAKSFRSAIDDLSRAYNNGRNQDRSDNEARRVLDIGSQISQEMYRSRVNNNMRYEWNEINNDLDVIAAAYGYNNNGRYRNNRNRNGGWRNNFPFPF